MGAIKSLQWWIRREGPVSGPGHWKVKPNLQKGSLTPCWPMRRIPRSQRPLSHRKGLTWWSLIIRKVVGRWCQVQKKEANAVFLVFVCVFFLIPGSWWTVWSPARPQASWSACRGVIVLSDCAELQSSGKMDGEGSWGDNESWCEEIRLLSSSPSFSRQFLWIKLLNKRSLWTNLLGSQVFASAEKELRSWISFCACRVALYLHPNQKSTVFTLSSLITWCG